MAKRPTTEWRRYLKHFGDDKSIEHAFYMGCLCGMSAREKRTDLASEVNAFVEEHGCLCDRCNELRASGGLLSIGELMGDGAITWK